MVPVLSRLSVRTADTEWLRLQPVSRVCHACRGTYHRNDHSIGCQRRRCVGIEPTLVSPLLPWSWRLLACWPLHQQRRQKRHSPEIKKVKPPRFPLLEDPTVAGW